MTDERIYMVVYDISDQRRWRQVFKVMNGFGEWVQLSVFQCRLTSKKRAELGARLQEIVKSGEDHVLLIDVGPVYEINVSIESIGKSFKRIEREAIVI